SWRSVPSGSAVAEHPVPRIDSPVVEAPTGGAYTREGNHSYGVSNGYGESSPAPERQRAGAGTGRDDRRTAPPSADGNRLNPKYMFETFVIGSSNRFAHAASV